MPAGFAPVKMPPLCVAMLAPGSESAGELVGRHLLFKWPPRLGGWAHGIVRAVNTNQTMKVAGKMCNFVVYYSADDETAEHVLRAHDYGHNSKSPANSWVLLGPLE